MIGGGILGMLIMVIYTLATGKLTLSKTRVVYGMPARAIALLCLVPMMLVCAYAIRLGGIANMPNGIGLFLAAFVVSIIIVYALGWPFSESPRR